MWGAAGRSDRNLCNLPVHVKEQGSEKWLFPVLSLFPPQAHGYLPSQLLQFQSPEDHLPLPGALRVFPV